MVRISQQRGLILGGLVIAVGIYFLQAAPPAPNALERYIELHRERLSPTAEEELAKLEEQLNNARRAGDIGVEVDATKALYDFWRPLDKGVAAFMAQQIAVISDNEADDFQAGSVLLEAALQQRLHNDSNKLYDYFVTRATACFNELLAQDSLNIPARLKLASCYEASGMVMDGVGQLRRVLELEPGQFDALLRLGKLALFSGQYERAKARFQTILADQRESVDGWVGLGQAYLGLSRSDSAAWAFEKALPHADSTTRLEIERILVTLN